MDKRQFISKLRTGARLLSLTGAIFLIYSSLLWASTTQIQKGFSRAEKKADYQLHYENRDRNEALKPINIEVKPISKIGALSLSFPRSLSNAIFKASTFDLFKNLNKATTFSFPTISYAKNKNSVDFINLILPFAPQKFGKILLVTTGRNYFNTDSRILHPSIGRDFIKDIRILTGADNRRYPSLNLRASALNKSVSILPNITQRTTDLVTPKLTQYAAYAAEKQFNHLQLPKAPRVKLTRSNIASRQKPVRSDGIVILLRITNGNDSLRFVEYSRRNNSPKPTPLFSISKAKENSLPRLTPKSKNNIFVFKSQNNFSLPLKQNRPNNNSNKNSNNEIPTEPALPPTPQPASQLPINPTHLPKVPTANTGNIFIHKGMEIGLIINLVKAKLPEYNIGFTQTEETLRDLFGIGTSQGNRASIT